MTTPYRDDREALEERLASLQAELGRVRDTLKTLGEEQRSADALEREIAALKAQLEDRFKKPALEDLKIAAPCSADWSAMDGDDRVRFCPSCQKNVYNLSALSRGDADKLLAQHEGKPPCVRLYKRRDGTVITNDCPVGVRRRRFRRIAAATVGGGLMAAGALMLRWRSSACGMTTQGEMVAHGSPVAMPLNAPPISTPAIMGTATAPDPSTSSVPIVPSASPDAKPSRFATPPNGAKR